MADIQGVLLAAGSAQRFGSHKLLHPLASGVMMGIAAARSLITALPNSLVVIRSNDHQLAEQFQLMGLKVVENSLAAQGMGQSLAMGIGACADATAWVVALADMPWIEPQTIRRIAQELTRGATLVAPVFQGRRGHPVGFGQKWRHQLQALQGDLGARELLAAHQNELILLPTDDRGVLLDIDHQTDLNR